MCLAIFGTQRREERRLRSIHLRHCWDLSLDLYVARGEYDPGASGIFLLTFL